MIVFNQFRSEFSDTFPNLVAHLAGFVGLVESVVEHRGLPLTTSPSVHQSLRRPVPAATSPSGDHSPAIPYRERSPMRSYTDAGGDRSRSQHRFAGARKIGLPLESWARREQPMNLGKPSSLVLRITAKPTNEIAIDSRRTRAE